MPDDARQRLIERAATVIKDNAALLNDLDSAIGDGDHGTNMARGFAAILEQSAALDGLAPGAALQKAGMTLVMKVGGASGPLYGSLLMGMGKAATGEALDSGQLAEMMAAGVEAVKRRGKSEAGEKTMLDVLVPVSAALAAGRGDGAARLAAKLVEAAERGLESTRGMLATKGRASFLGERSVGHLDPGAMSSSLLVKEVCAVIGEST